MSPRRDSTRFTPVSAALAALLSLAACAEPTGLAYGGGLITELPRELTAAEASLIDASNDFGLELFRTAAAADTRSNVILSPLSASMALGMTLNGTDGNTFEAMRTTLGFGSLTQEEINDSYRDLIDLLTGLDPAVRFEIANSVWTRDTVPFHDSFFEAVAAAFDAVAASRDFDDPGTVDEINAWVDANTGGYIDSIVEQLDPLLVMLLVNAIYLDAQWTFQFDSEDTRTATFTREDSSTVSVEMMSLTDVELRGSATSSYTAVELPYGGRAFSMLVLLPSRGTTVRELLDELDPPAWDELIEGLTTTEFRVDLPKFTLTHDAWLNDTLMDMGMEVAFTPDADFTRMSPLGDSLCISFVRQKTFMEVDERGTRAAAATAVGVSLESGPPTLIADRPFLLAIRERLSGTLLFAGLVGDPTGEDPGPDPPTVLCG